MKFLPENMDNKNLMILNTYYDRGTWGNPDDVLDIVYKDIDTKKKYVYTSINPIVEVYIVKPEYREKVKMIEESLPSSWCYPIRVHYKTMYAEIGKELGMSKEQAKFSQYAYHIPEDIETYYQMQFKLEYPAEAPKELSVGFLDIETDIISITGFPEHGEVPINAVSYLDYERMQMYTFIYLKDDIPVLKPSDPKYEYYENLRAKFKNMTDEFVDNLKPFKEMLNEEYDEIYGKINYNLLCFDDEEKMIITLFNVLRASQNDYIMIWNQGFDNNYLIDRPRALGMDVESLFVDPLFLQHPKFQSGELQRKVYFKEDKNPVAHKRRHVSVTYSLFTFVCQMISYAGIRANRGKLPSLKLNAIGKAEFGDEKVDYSEYGNFRYFPYIDFKKFIQYNIKDVLLQSGIHSVTHDIDAIYQIFSNDMVKLNQCFTSTAVVANSFREFVFTHLDLVLGPNRNKLFNNEDSYVYQYNYDDDDVTDEDDDDDDTEEESGSGKKKKKKFTGAFVMHPKHMTESGTVINGELCKYVHVCVIDFDITAELTIREAQDKPNLKRGRTR